MITPSRASEWFTPAATGGETGSEPPPPNIPAPCRHQVMNEHLRNWLSRRPEDARITVAEILMILGRA